MTEPGFREIQLSTKQVVFLFMAFVVVAVAIFLLGVSVGQGVSEGKIAADATATPDTTVEVIPANPAAPGLTPPQADKLTYHDELQKAPSTPPAPMPDAPPEAKPTPAATPESTPAKSAAASKPPAPGAAKPAPPAKPAGTLFLQVDSFSSKGNAERQVTQLKAEGFSSAFVFVASGPGARYKTRVGPFADAAARDATLAKLRKEGYTPSPIR